MNNPAPIYHLAYLDFPGYLLKWGTGLDSLGGWECAEVIGRDTALSLVMAESSHEIQFEAALGRHGIRYVQHRTVRQSFYNQPTLGLPGDWKKLEHLVIPGSALDTLQI